MIFLKGVKIKVMQEVIYSSELDNTKIWIQVQS